MVAGLEGDTAVYACLLAELDVFVHRYIRAKQKWPQETVDEVAQEVLLAVHKSRASFDPQRSFLSWLLAIVHFKMADHLRQVYQDKEGGEIVRTIKTLQQEWNAMNLSSETSPQVGALEALFEGLDEQAKAILVRVKIEGRKHQEVATEFGLSVANVKVIVFRSLKKLKLRSENKSGKE